MTYAQLLAFIDQHINTKTGVDRITGALDNMVRKQMVASIVEIASTGFGAELAIADNPGVPPKPVYFLAAEVGTYPNAGSVVVENLPAFILWNGTSWAVREFGAVVDVIAPESPAKGIVTAGAAAPSAPALKDWFVFVGPGELAWPGQPKTSPGIVYCTSLNPIRWNFQPFGTASDDAVEEITVDNAQVFDPAREGGYKAGNVYVSYVNPNSEDPLFLQEALYRCDLDAAMGESPESHPWKWIYQGDRVTVVSRNTVSAVVQDLDSLRALQEPKDSDSVIVVDENAWFKFDAVALSGVAANDGTVGFWVNKGATGGDKQKTYSIDFGSSSHVASEINMLGDIVITAIAANNVDSVLLTYSGGIQQPVSLGAVNIAVPASDVLIWEITRQAADMPAVLGVKFEII